MFTQPVNPLGNLAVTWLVALIPVVTLLVLLAVLRMSAWAATLIGSVVTLLLGIFVWGMPPGDGILAYLYGSATGAWNVNWITFWGVMLFNTLVVSGVFDRFRRWLLTQGTQDVRVQAILFAWAFGALLEGFGRVWLSLGGGRADPDHARDPRSRRVAGRRDRQQCAGLLRRARSADHRAQRGHGFAAPGAVGVDRPHRGDPRPAAAVDPDLSGCGKGGTARRLAARDCRLARLHRRTVPGCRLLGPLPARHRRGDRQLCAAPAAAQDLAAGNVFSATAAFRFRPPSSPAAMPPLTGSPAARCFRHGCPSRCW